MSKQETTLLTLFTLFFITLYFSQINAINLAVAGVLVIYSFSVGTIKEKLSLLKERKFIQWTIVFFVLLLMSTLFSDNLSKGIHYLKLRIPLLVFPLSIGLLKLRPAFKEKLLSSFTFTTIGICAACLIYSIYNYTYHNQTDAFYNDNFTSLLEQQSVYISLLVNFALFVIGYKVVNKKTSSPLLLIAGGFFLVLISYFLGSRINIGVLAMVAVSFGFYYLITNKKILETATLCLGLMMAGVIVYKVQPQMLNRFKELSYNKYEYSNMGLESHYGMELKEDQWNGANFRLAAWSCGWEIFTENPVVGVGLGDKKDRLFSKYEQKDFQFAIQTNKNVHSNYIDVLYSLGVVGFLLFVFTWLMLPLVFALKHRNWLGIVFIFSLACAWVTEIYFDRSLGGMITGFFIPFILIAVEEE